MLRAVPEKVSTKPLLFLCFFLTLREPAQTSPRPTLLDSLCRRQTTPEISLHTLVIVLSGSTLLHSPVGVTFTACEALESLDYLWYRVSVSPQQLAQRSANKYVRNQWPNSLSVL